MDKAQGDKNLTAHISRNQSDYKMNQDQPQYRSMQNSQSEEICNQAPTSQELNQNQKSQFQSLQSKQQRLNGPQIPESKDDLNTSNSMTRKVTVNNINKNSAKILSNKQFKRQYANQNATTNAYKQRTFKETDLFKASISYSLFEKPCNMSENKAYANSVVTQLQLAKRQQRLSGQIHGGFNQSMTNENTDQHQQQQLSSSIVNINTCSQQQLAPSHLAGNNMVNPDSIEQISEVKHLVRQSQSSIESLKKQKHSNRRSANDVGMVYRATTIQANNKTQDPKLSSSTFQTVNNNYNNQWQQRPQTSRLTSHSQTCMSFKGASKSYARLRKAYNDAINWSVVDQDQSVVHLGSSKTFTNLGNKKSLQTCHLKKQTKGSNFHQHNHSDVVESTLDTNKQLKTIYLNNLANKFSTTNTLKDQQVDNVANMWKLTNKAYSGNMQHNTKDKSTASLVGNRHASAKSLCNHQRNAYNFINLDNNQRASKDVQKITELTNQPCYRSYGISSYMHLNRAQAPNHNADYRTAYQTNDKVFRRVNGEFSDYANQMSNQRQHPRSAIRSNK